MPKPAKKSSVIASNAVRRPFSCIVYGEPAPQGSKRYVGQSKSGKGLMIESSKKVKPWRAAIVAELNDWNAHAQVFDCPIAVTMVFTLRRPKKPMFDSPGTKPDLSKLVRSTEDALKDSGIITDDSRITWLYAVKTYPNCHTNSLGVPGVYIEIRETK